MIDNRACDPHRNTAHRQITFPLHARHGQASTGKTQQLFLDIRRNHLVARILHIMTIDRKCRNPFLVVRSQRSRQIDRARALGAVKAPDSFRAQRVHIDGFAAVAPARGHGNRQANVRGAELLFAGGGFRHTGDATVGNHAFNGRSTGVTQFFTQQRSRGFRHVHGLLFQRFAHSHPAAINYRSNANTG